MTLRIRARSRLNVPRWPLQFLCVTWLSSRCIFEDIRVFSLKQAFDLQRSNLAVFKVISKRKIFHSFYFWSQKYGVPIKKIDLTLKWSSRSLSNPRSDRPGKNHKNPVPSFSFRTHIFRVILLFRYFYNTLYVRTCYTFLLVFNNCMHVINLFVFVLTWTLLHMQCKTDEMILSPCQAVSMLPRKFPLLFIDLVKFIHISFCIKEVT